ncbi:MAG TPA: M48 family metalloprotease [Candidatus Nitrosotenuis sp.]|nr:M48 family metalloprotease [Candidatus Nitrosotenuis sp.]
MKKKVLVFAAVLAGLVSVGTLAPLAEEPKPGAPMYNIFSDEDEQVLGRQAAAETIQKLPMLDDPIVNAYVNDIGQRIARESRRPDIKYEFRVVNSNKVNAFALPAGFVFVERGLLHYVESEYELIGAMSHEVGHVVGRHGLANVSRIAIVKMAVESAKKLGVLDPDTIQKIFDASGGVAFVFINAKFSRDQESEADLLGAYNSVRSGWDPSGAVIVFQKFAKGTREQDLLQMMLATHPHPAERARVISDEIKTMKLPPNLQTDSYAFRAMKLRLGMLGAPPPDPRDQKRQQ